MNQVYIIGHKKPDTDSICSVIGYAELKNHLTDSSTYIPARCGDINAETAYALEKFGVEAPQFVESVEPSVSDIPFTYTVSARQDVPTIDVVEMMDAHEVRNIPITDGEGRLVGLISEHGLARAYIRRQKIEPLSIAPMKLDTLARILKAEIVVEARDLLAGNVYTAVDALHVTLSKITPNDVAIVGDNEPAQLALISAGIAALIIADGAPVGERVRQQSQEHGISLLTTTLDAFGVGKMINLSLPARHVMATDMPTVGMDDLLANVKDLVSVSPYRTACVIDEKNRLLGMISRNTFLKEVSKSVILLDHNELTQAVDGIENAEILEIIDHHRIGAITTLKPITFINEPVGSTSTIITEKFRKAGIAPKESTAGLLLSGILSDTLVLRLSTTTAADHAAVEYLAGIIGIDPIEYGTDLIRRGMELEGTPIEEILIQDMKEYHLFGQDVTISQVMVPTFDFSARHAREILAELRRLRGSSGIAVALFTSVFENASEVFTVADGPVLEKLGLTEQPTRMDGVMSRKKDFLPRLGRMLKTI